MLKPALQSGQIRCVGSTTFVEYRQYFEKDRALQRRFQKIDVAEPTVEEAYKIMYGLKINMSHFIKLNIQMKLSEHQLIFLLNISEIKITR